MLDEKAVLRCSFLFESHVDMGSLVALVLRMPPDCAYSAVQMHFEYACMPQRIVNCLPRNASISRDKLLVPLWGLASWYHRNRLSCVQIILPMRKVEHQTQVVPRENTCEACAQLLGVGRLYVLVWAFMYAELNLAVRVGKYWAY